MRMPSKGVPYLTLVSALVMQVAAHGYLLPYHV